MTQTRESRPEANRAAITKALAGAYSQDTEREQIARAARAPYALVVLTGLRTGGTRRNVYFSLPSAQAALTRAEKRGVAASLHLVRLEPVPFVTVDALAELVGGECA